ncbi:hypothetical protein ERO13_D09G018125v2 [Gossypium hirsutum]|nr:hypothetical protein ERO13_D09G018125v2 [Gossypium hirsutum]
MRPSLAFSYLLLVAVLVVGRYQIHYHSLPSHFLSKPYWRPTYDINSFAHPTKLRVSLPAITVHFLLIELFKKSLLQFSTRRLILNH